MPASDPFQRLCDDFEDVVSDLRLIAQSEGLGDEDKLAILAMLQTIGGCFVTIGNVMDSGNQDEVTKAIKAFEPVAEQSRQIVRQHSTLAGRS